MGILSCSASEPYAASHVRRITIDVGTLYVEGMRSSSPQLGKILSPTLVLLLLAMGTIGFHLGVARSETDATRAFANPTTVALARAVAAGQSAQVRALVGQGANLSDKGLRDINLLQWAMLQDQPRMLKLLLELGADPSQQGQGGQTALHTAAMAKRKPYLKLLLEGGANPDATNGRTQASVLAEALMSGNREAVALLLAHRANPNLADRQGDTPLHVAAQINDYDGMLALLKAGANPAIRNRSGKTFAVYFAIRPRESLMSWEAKSARKAVQAWLSSHGYGEMAE